MQLGALMDQMVFGDDASDALEALDDIVLFAQVQSTGTRFGECPGEYVANAARRFSALAGDEDWLQLMSTIERSADPARAALAHMIRWALKSDAAKPASVSYSRFDESVAGAGEVIGEACPQTDCSSVDAGTGNPMVTSFGSAATSNSHHLPRSQLAHHE